MRRKLATYGGLSLTRLLCSTRAQVNMLNFVATRAGLTEQMLGIVVAAKAPELQRQSVDLMRQAAANSKALQDVEDKVKQHLGWCGVHAALLIAGRGGCCCWACQILALLNKAQGNILDDEVLINALSASKAAANQVRAWVGGCQTERTKAGLM